MKLIVISGISGAGKSVVMHSLEDLDYYCVDNLPLELLPSLAVELRRDNRFPISHAAVAIDARNAGAEFERFPQIMAQIQASGVDCEIVFLEAENDVLIQRFSETRRKHPLTADNLSLAEALARERTLLEPVRRQASYRIDTTSTHLHQLRDLIRQRVDRRPRGNLTVMFESFGFKHGVPPDADMVFDVRCLPNPYWEPTLRDYSGLDEPVRTFLMAQPPAVAMVESLRDFLARWIPSFEAENRAYLTVAVGCTGGMHRSVFIIEQLGGHFKALREGVLIRHRELPS